jgi:hypothetical protein
MASEHLDDLRRQLPDWIRAHAGWTEPALEEACSVTQGVIGAGRTGATVELAGTCVHLHLDSGRDLDLRACPF